MMDVNWTGTCSSDFLGYGVSMTFRRVFLKTNQSNSFVYHYLNYLIDVFCFCSQKMIITLEKFGIVLGFIQLISQMFWSTESL